MVDTGLFKKATIRFEKLMPIITPQDAVTAIINAQRKGIEEASIPSHLAYLNAWFRIFPSKSAKAMKDFLNAYVDSDT